jgi:hypothetical protein
MPYPRAVRSLRRGIILAGSRVAETALACVGVRRPEIVLVLGHMRSGSTLLLHILLSHPAISGMGERNATYSTNADLARLVIATRVARRQPFARFRYVVDQLNHDRFTPAPAVLQHSRVRLLFLIREPRGSIASLLELTRTYYEPWPLARAVDYYVERLGTLARYARSIDRPERAAFLTYQDVTERSRQSLTSLASFLGTEPPFSDTYPVHGFTGRRGDPGQVISAGRIIQSRTHDLPPEADGELARAQRAYEESLRALAPLALVDRDSGAD